MSTRMPPRLLLALIALLALSACDEASTAKKADPKSCDIYLEKAKACEEKNEGKALAAIQAVSSANRATLDKADTPAKKEALVKECAKWVDFLADNPKCQ